MIMVAFIMASKYIHDCLRLVIYTSSRERSPHFNSMPHSPKAPVQFIRSTPPLTPPLTSIELSENKPNNPIETLPKDKERTMRIARMEQEFLFFLNYDLSVQDPILLVKWAHSYQVPDGQGLETEEYTSADEGDDEMDDEET
ncbi:MAG: hypothetical protein JSY10_30140 [Paenibacillus sp.]|nr:hypothetical protein [Paenibacillus sp.]